MESSNNGFTQRRIRILHVLGMMERAGAETWLMHILRTLDRSRFQMDFLVHNPEPQEYDDEVRALGSNLMVLPHIHHPLTYARGFSRILRDNGPYDVVHSHVHQYSGFVLRLAKHAGVPIRIAHSHLDASDIEARASLPRRAYSRLMRHWLEENMTTGLSVSGVAAADLFGPHWACDPRHQLLFCGIEMELFRQPVCRAEVRAAFGIPEHAFVVGHVGRFAEQKNHTFLLDIAVAVVQRAPDVRFLLVGDGVLREVMEAKAAALGLTGRVIFAGPRADVPRLMLGAMDTFLLPSRYEGLPLVLMEAQAAGLPCVFSDNTATEADIVPALIHRRSLTVPASSWAETLLAVRASGSAISRDEAFAIAQATPFNVQTSWKLLERVYVQH